jgi:hypothetical protein
MHQLIKTTIFLLLALSAIQFSSISVGFSAPMTQEEIVTRRALEEERQALRLASLRAKDEYKRAIELCQASGISEVIKKYGPLSWDAAVDVSAMFVSPVDNVARAYRNNFIAPEVIALMENESFKLALQDCGGLERTVTRMGAADYVGKFAGISGIAITFRFLKQRYSTFATNHAWAPYGLMTLSIAYGIWQMQKLTELLVNKPEIQKKIDGAVAKEGGAIEHAKDQRRNAYTDSLKAELKLLEEKISSSGLPPERLEADIGRAYRIRMIISIYEKGA